MNRTTVCCSRAEAHGDSLQFFLRVSEVDAKRVGALFHHLTNFSRIRDNRLRIAGSVVLVVFFTYPPAPRRCRQSPSQVLDLACITGVSPSISERRERSALARRLNRRRLETKCDCLGLARNVRKRYLRPSPRRRPRRLRRGTGGADGAASSYSLSSTSTSAGRLHGDRHFNHPLWHFNFLFD